MYHCTWSVILTVTNNPSADSVSGRVIDVVLGPILRFLDQDQQVKGTQRGSGRNLLFLDLGQC